MKVLVAGDFAFEFYEPDFCFGLREAGCEVIELPALRFFGPGSLLRRAQTRLVAGPGVAAANAALVAACARHKPDVVLLWRTPWATPLSLWLCRAAGAGKVALYNNDDPFGPDRDLRIWRRWRALLPHADATFVYREVNVAEARAAGARHVSVLRSAFHPLRHRPPGVPPDCDVVFAGHCEDDGRLDALDALVRDGSLRVRLFGTGWERALRGRPAQALLPVVPVFGEAYVRAIASAKAALVFLSGRNRDQYTRRCFEIPAIGTPMLAPPTGELRALFGDDALWYGSPAELLTQARLVCRDEAVRGRYAAAGRRRVVEGGHDVISRAREFIRAMAP